MLFGLENLFLTGQCCVPEIFEAGLSVPAYIKTRADGAVSAENIVLESGNVIGPFQFDPFTIRTCIIIGGILPVIFYFQPYAFFSE